MDYFVYNKNIIVWQHNLPQLRCWTNPSHVITVSEKIRFQRQGFIVISYKVSMNKS